MAEPHPHIPLAHPAWRGDGLELVKDTLAWEQGKWESQDVHAGVRVCVDTHI